MRKFLSQFPEWVKAGTEAFVCSHNFKREVTSVRKIEVRTVSVKRTLVNGRLRANDTTLRPIDDPAMIAIFESQERAKIEKADRDKPLKTETFELKREAISVALFSDGRHEFSLDFMKVRWEPESNDIFLGCDSISNEDALRFATLIEAAHSIRLKA